MKFGKAELWLALAAVFLITAVYLAAVARSGSVPGASGLAGHGLGVAGFVLMLMTETLYSLRKRSRLARWGRMSTWLRFHIFTGLVGPYMVLLHTAWRFNGLAGVVTMMTLIVVASGILGRYIYTAIPRTADGAEMEAGALEAEISAAEAELQAWLASRPETAPVAAGMLATGQVAAGDARAVLGRGFEGAGHRLRWLRAQQGMDAGAREQMHRLQQLIDRRRLLDRQVASLVAARRTLALWHTVHIPLGMAMFAAALAHILAALYFGTLSR